VKRHSLHPPHPFIRKLKEQEAARLKASQEAAAKPTASVGAGPYEAARTAENLVRDPSLRVGSGVRAVAVDEADALVCAAYLQQHWLPFGSLTFPGRKPINGYATYTETHAPHDPKLQPAHTLLLKGARLADALEFLPRFARMANSLAAHLERILGGRFQLAHAHALRQGPLTQSTTAFKTHQDTESDDSIDRSAVVKLTADLPGEAPSRMTVLGAAYPFAYGPAAGSAGHFDSRLWHASVAPGSEREHLKITFFFRRFSTRGMRAARRAA
jgi:hypothetical protein